jgi:hypothetical protein
MQHYNFVWTLQPTGLYLIHSDFSVFHLYVEMVLIFSMDPCILYQSEAEGILFALSAPS